MNIIKKIERFGSSSGYPSAIIRVSNCGELTKSVNFDPGFLAVKN